MRNKIVAGNWKMNLNLSEAEALVDSILNQMPSLPENQQVIFCTPFTHLAKVAERIQANGAKQIYLGAQNCNDKLSGAFTGEISVRMLKEIGVSHVIIGHSERRQLFNESDAFLKSKVDTLVAEQMQILFCCGESIDFRNSNTQNEFVASQLKASLFHLSAEQLQGHVTIAYEPIWAIGTGVTATTEQAQEMHAFIRNLIAEHYNAEVAKQISILYGGSCNAQNAQELFANEDVDGGLIGGAALKAETFLPIISAMN
jgi:triosephosphate isomerase